jgi:hypothetical protein
MFCNRMIRRCAKPALASSALFMLLVQPVVLRTTANCGCCSTEARESGSDSCCSARQTAGGCCGEQPTSCCSQTPTCCSSRAGNRARACQCGDRCQCSTRKQPLNPAPFVPTNESGQDQIQLVLLLAQLSSGLDSVESGDGVRPLDCTAGLALTAQQVCILLSRFTC